ncbi:hypothetical protein [Sporomusa termitida]|uniref:Uncharacterized protein n=1 Tax=Sporomusa termitida TaxID=2377 RepID=A0A517E081_9FIRM|nr:hypothetical protein [Sporomusa termitida]QDR83014.1 hypothetical protein SPTER_44700 [Sporomusa termitida]
MLKDYPATQLFLISLVVLLILIFITPFIREWHVWALLLDSLKFIVKVICGFFLLCTIVIDGESIFAKIKSHR